MIDSSPSVKSKFVGIMLAPFLSKAGLNSLFSLFLGLVVVPLVIGDSYGQGSVLIATFPALFICAGLWFNFTNRIYS